MIDIRLLAQLKPMDLQHLATGYASAAKYHVRKTESDKQLALSLELIPLPQPYHKRYDHLDEETLAHYGRVVAHGFSFGAYDRELCIGITIAEVQQWNRSLWVRELHVAESHRRCGVGRRLVDALTDKAHTAGLRTVVCETQNTNVPAICFYRKVGFHFEGIDLSYYTNDDFPNGEIAVFMKKRVLP